MYKKKIDYYVMDGPDSRHLISTVIYKKRKDAEDYIERLGEKRAYQFGRLTYPCAYSVWENKTIISERTV